MRRRLADITFIEGVSIYEIYNLKAEKNQVPGRTFQEGTLINVFAKLGSHLQVLEELAHMGNWENY
jgi:hypothetical protein